MKLKPGFDDEFRPKGDGWPWPVRSIGWLMVVAAVCGAALPVMAGIGKHKKNLRNSPARVQRPIQAWQTKALVALPRDPFVKVAAPEIDPEMVVPAPVGIDEAMVFDPYMGKLRTELGALAPESAITPLPGNQPGQVPSFVHPFQPLPQWPAPAPPR